MPRVPPCRSDSPHRLWPTDPADLTAVLETACLIEQLGFDHVIAGTHLLAGGLGLSPDPMVLLAAVAGANSRFRVASSILIAPFTSPLSSRTRPRRRTRSAADASSSASAPAGTVPSSKPWAPVQAAALPDVLAWAAAIAGDIA